jgi:hypothetical protein
VNEADRWARAIEILLQAARAPEKKQEPTTPLELRAVVIETRDAYYRGKATEQQMNDAADAYIASVVTRPSKRRLGRVGESSCRSSSRALRRPPFEPGPGDAWS